MKLQNELDFVCARFKTLRGVPEYAAALKESGAYNDYITRLAWDLLRLTVRSDTICQWYVNYKCNDTHITTLAKRALRDVFGIC